MKLLFDQNLSYKLAEELQKIFPDSTHVRMMNLHTASDMDIWEYAKQNDYIIVTQDSDFYERSLLFGYPPKILWLRCGNTSSKNILRIIKNNQFPITDFEKDENLGCLEIY